MLQAGYELVKAGSPSIQTGKSENIYAAICKGNELSLAINGKSMPGVKTKYHFREGNIGIGFSALQDHRTKVDFESLKITQP